MIQFANRLNTIKEYYFSKKLREVRELTAIGKPIINMGIGSPDLQPPQNSIETLQKTVDQKTAHKYQSYQGLPELRNAFESFYKKHYDVNINSEGEVLPLMGSKEGILHISLAVLNKGDEVLIPNPGYPTYTSVTNLIEAKPVYYNLEEVSNYQPNFEILEQRDLSKVKLMWVNYPHMPTGINATKSTLEKLISFGKKHKILIVNDNPYSLILTKKPQSILQISGAKDIALELNSLSKSFNMAGWRVGVLAGKKDYLNEIIKVKTQQDSGMFFSIQQGAIQALNENNNWFEKLNNTYTKRRKLIWKFLDKLACTYNRNTSGMFVWAKLPNNSNSEKFVDDLLYNKNIFVAPGTVFGNQGKGYIRISLCVDEKNIIKAINRVS